MLTPWTASGPEDESDERCAPKTRHVSSPFVFFPSLNAILPERPDDLHRGCRERHPTVEQQFPTRFADSISSRDAKNLPPARARAESLRWLQKFHDAFRRSIENELATGSSTIGLSFSDGILLLTFGRDRRKIFEIYDRIAIGGIGHPGDIERLRVMAIELAKYRRIHPFCRGRVAPSHGELFF